MFPASFIESEFKFNTVYGGFVEKVTPPQNYLEGIAVRQEVFLYSSAGVHWIELQSDGSLRHSLYREGERAKQHLWGFSSSVKQFSAILFHGYLHMLMASEAGIYYARCSINSPIEEKQELRVSGHPSSNHPYLFGLGRTLFLSYTMIRNEKLAYVLRRYEQGRWEEREFFYVHEDYGANVHIEQASWDISESGVLYGLLLIRHADTNKQELLLLELDIEAEEPKWVPVFTSTQTEQSWKITVSAAGEEEPCLAWIVCNGATTKLFFARGRNAAHSGLPLKVYFDKQSIIPHLMMAGSNGMLLAVTGSSRISCTYSSNGGQDWGSFMDIPFTRESKLRIIHGIRIIAHGIVPAQLIGWGYPHFRPIELMDLLHPYLTMSSMHPPVQDDMLLQYAQLQLSLWQHYASATIAAWQGELMMLDERKTQEEYALQRVEEHIEEMEREELRLMEQLHAGDGNMEPFGIRLIQ